MPVSLLVLTSNNAIQKIQRFQVCSWISECLIWLTVSELVLELFALAVIFNWDVEGLLNDKSPTIVCQDNFKLESFNANLFQVRNL